MPSASLPLLLASAAVSLLLSLQPAHARGHSLDPDLAMSRSYSWNTPFRFPRPAPGAVTRRRLPDGDLERLTRLARSEGGDLDLMTRLARSDAGRSLFSLLLWPHLQTSEMAPYRRDARGMKRKMFWSPLGYVPHRDIEASDSDREAGDASQGAALFRYG